MRPACNGALEGRVFAADVIEHAIKNDAQAAATCSVDQRIEILAVAKPFVDLKVVDGVVAMGR